MMYIIVTFIIFCCVSQLGIIIKPIVDMQRKDVNCAAHVRCATQMGWWNLTEQPIQGRRLLKQHLSIILVNGWFTLLGNPPSCSTGHVLITG